MSPILSTGAICALVVASLIGLTMRYGPFGGPAGVPATGPLTPRSALVLAMDKLFLHPDATQDVTLSAMWPTHKDRFEAWRTAFRAWEISKGRGPEMQKVEQVLVPALKGGSRIPVSLYTPQSRASGVLGELDTSQQLRPVLVWLHGGFWSAGSRNGTDAVARQLADHASALVVSVGYGLAPRRKYPTAVDEIGS